MRQLQLRSGMLLHFLFLPKVGQICLCRARTKAERGSSALSFLAPALLLGMFDQELMSF